MHIGRTQYHSVRCYLWLYALPKSLGMYPLWMGGGLLYLKNKMVSHIVGQEDISAVVNHGFRILLIILDI